MHPFTIKVIGLFFSELRVKMLY